MNKRLLTILLPLLLMISGCSFNSGRIQLFNYDVGSFFNNHPDRITVKRGDTLYSISKRYNIPLRDLIEANNLTPPYNLNIGRVLRMPNQRYHVVSKGDTLYNISKRYNVDVTSLSRANRLSVPYALNIGQRLTLPGSVGTTYNTPASQSTSTSSRWSWGSNQSSKPSSGATYSKPASAPKPRKNKFAWPVQGKVISRYGALGQGRTNDGINIQAPLGTTVKAADKGSIAYAGNELKGFGNLILIRHDDGWITAYAHNDRLFVKKGQRVTKGEKISTVGSTGGVNSPQLHFEVRSGKKALNPQAYLP